MVRKLDMPPTTVPLSEAGGLATDRLVNELANLGYPGFAHLARPDQELRNPTAVLLDALRADSLDSRAVEALPWVVATFRDLDWHWLVPQVKVLDLQNRLGFVVALGRQVAERSRAGTTTALRDREKSLEQSRLVKEDVFGRSGMTNAEKLWLRANRSEPAARWNVLSNLTAEHLRDVGSTP